MNRLRSETYQKDLQSICEEKLPFEKLAGCRILVTGATGLIGSCLVDTFMYLKRTGKLPMKLDVLCRARSRAERFFGDYVNDTDFHIIEGDLTGNVQLLERYDYVIHGAGNNHPVAFAGEPVETMKTSLLGTMNLLDMLVKQKDSHPVFLFLSTGEIYGNVSKQNEKGCTEEDIGSIDSMNPRSCYPEAKRAAETLCVSYAREYGLHTKVARLAYIFGATYQEESTKADVQFLKKSVAGEDIVMKSPGRQYRSYCYLADAVTGILYILLLGESGQAYNVANQKGDVTIRRFAEILAETAGVQVKFENPEGVEQRGYSTLNQEILNPEKLEHLGYRAKVELKEAFDRILNIHKESENLCSHR